MNAPANVARKRVNLALQGGGSHGAFTWGVLDKFLEDGRLDIEAISGTSAGAMNAVVLADGFQEGGAEGARKQLEEFWSEVSRCAVFSPIRRGPLSSLLGTWSLGNSPAVLWFDLMSKIFSPYDVNPFDYNPLRDLLTKTVDLTRVHACKDIKLFVSATNVYSGKGRVFDNFDKKDLTLDAVMASACIPTLYKAVVIDNEPYWDGGFMGNPVLWPFFYATHTNDLLLIEVNPIRRPTTPHTAREIEDRMNEITFNASLQHELRAIRFVSRLLREGKLDLKRYKDIRLHVVDNADAMIALGASSKLNAEWDFLVYLRDLGRDTAARWLDKNFEKLGEQASADPTQMIT